MRKTKQDNLDDKSVMLPEVIIDFECEEDSLFLVIANVGLSSAHRIAVQCNKEIQDFRGKQVMDMQLLRKLEFLPPGKKIRLFIDSFSSYLKAKQPMRLEFSISYFDRNHRPQTNLIRHKLAIYRGIITSSVNLADDGK